MQIGYVRVSTNDQNTALQREALERSGCELIFEDKMSGKVAVRPGLKKALKLIKEGDSLVVWKLDRLGRSVQHLITLVSGLQNSGIHFRSLTDNIDTGTTSGRFFFHVMSALAEMERELIIERTKAGLEAARKEGRIGGRRKIMTDDKVAQAGRLLANGHSRREVALIYGVAVSTIYKLHPVSRSPAAKDMP
ncbi:MAG TPA: recombinase family protein [Buttiauxella sp.]|jgi:DNA invertase Pin-like site-specific DNA recombinase